MTKRIEFIDAMRGFTMILVVLCHVAGFCLGIENDIPSIHPFLYEFRMPTFFFISGFVLYKADQIWSAKNVLLFLKKKFPVQIITTIIFFSTFLYVNGISLTEGVFNESKHGYWFTYTLFLYFVAYTISQYFFQLLNLSGRIKDILTISLGLVFYLLFSVDSIFYALPINSQFKDFLSMHHWGYYLFFTIGTLFKKHFTTIQYLLDEKPVILTSLIVFFILNIFRPRMMSSHINIFNLLTAISGIVLLFSFFRKHETIFSKEKMIGKSLQLIGRKTLDIYLLHYFLLPLNLYAHTAFLRETPMPLIELIISLLISLGIICGCLLISAILRMSPCTAYYLFGVKKTKQP